MQHHRMLGDVDVDHAHRHQCGVMLLASSHHSGVKGLGPADVHRHHRSVTESKKFVMDLGGGMWLGGGGVSVQTLNQ